MRILHISNAGLPDLRIEKMAHTMNKAGHELVFLGGRPVTDQNLNAFHETHSLWLKNAFRIVYDSRVKRNWLEKIAELKPDVIHIHNIIVGNFLIGTDYNCIFDDHEYYSKQSSRYDNWPFFRRQLVKPMIRRFAKWEEQLSSSFPTLTSNKNIAEEHGRYGSFVKQVPNVPLRSQIEGLVEPPSRKGLAYVGNDFNMKRFLPHRNMEGLTDILEVCPIFGLSHRMMMEKLMHFEVGLTPWRSHPWHVYSEANKNYEYMHAGMPVLTNSIIKSSNFPDDPYVFSFIDYSDIKESLESIPKLDRNRIETHAKEKYIWENSESVIHEAYEKALR